MKRILKLFLVMAVFFTTTGCGSGGGESQNTVLGNGTSNSNPSIQNSPVQVQPAEQRLASLGIVFNQVGTETINGVAVPTYIIDHNNMYPLRTSYYDAMNALSDFISVGYSALYTIGSNNASYWVLRMKLDQADREVINFQNHPSIFYYPS